MGTGLIAWFAREILHWVFPKWEAWGQSLYQWPEWSNDLAKTKFTRCRTSGQEASWKHCSLGCHPLTLVNPCVSKCFQTILPAWRCVHEPQQELTSQFFGCSCRVYHAHVLCERSLGEFTQQWSANCGQNQSHQVLLKIKLNKMMPIESSQRWKILCRLQATPALRIEFRFGSDAPF